MLGVGVAAVATVLTGGLVSLFGLATGAAIAGGFVGVATGAGAANVTYNIVRDLQNSEKAFKKLRSNFDCLACYASSMSTSALQVQNTLVTLAMSVNDVEQCKRKHEKAVDDVQEHSQRKREKSVDDVEHSQKKSEFFGSLCDSLNRLCEKFSESFKVVSKCRANMVQQFKQK